MAGFHGTPHFHNQPGLPIVKVGAREFMCVGALPPFDHPHIFIDMGDETDVVCSYCSTRYVYEAALPTLCQPEECLYMPDAAQVRRDGASFNHDNLADAAAPGKAGKAG